MLDPSLAGQLKGYLANLRHPVELVAAVDDGPKSAELIALLDEIAATAGLITVGRGDDARRPSFAVVRAGTDISVRFAGIPLGHEFTSLVLALLHVGGHPAKEAAETLERVRQLEGHYSFETYYSLSCQNCPDVVQALNLMSVLNPGIEHVAIDGALFPAEVEARGVLAVPTVFLNGELFDSGRMTLEQIVAKLDAGAGAREAERLAAKDPFDVLIVGGGPAATSAAVYAARKGIRTGLVAERLGGQVLDTLGIENLVSVPHTEGPQLASALEHRVREHHVDVMPSQRATRLVASEDGGGLIDVELEGGAALRSRAVIVATGARWRQLGVPGEAAYRNKGVTYCPHCDGPLFAGKRVAVIGGGNSGVEAAIDLAGIAAHVTLIEFDAELRADDVLLRALGSLPNVNVITGAMTTEVLGDGARVTGLMYEERATGTSRELAVDGLFVQIGLLPNTEWLEGTLELSPRGEVAIDQAGHTSVPGVFAAGDCTTVPYKQIVVAFGAGATAALSAFDHLIRTPTPADDSRTLTSA